MTWRKLESEALAAFAWDEPKQILYVKFRESGEVYRYFNVPAEEYNGFLAAESKGAFFGKRIRNRFRWERMAKLSAL